jgi:hypothetical protein
MSRCRASPRPKASSAWRSRPQAPSVAWRPRLETAILGLPFVECRAADLVLAAQVSHLRPGLLLKTPMICSSVNRLAFMSIPPAGDGLYPVLEEFAGLRSSQVRALVRPPSFSRTWRFSRREKNRCLQPRFTILYQTDLLWRNGTARDVFICVT